MTNLDVIRKASKFELATILALLVLGVCDNKPDFGEVLLLMLEFLSEEAKT